MEQFKTFTPPQTRTYLTKATSGILDAYVSARGSYSIDIPPRSGKTNIIYNSAIEGVYSFDCPFTIVLSPWLSLKRQLCNEEKILSHIDIYSTNRSIITSAIDGFSNSHFWNIEDEEFRPAIWSASLSMAYHQITNLRTALEEAGAAHNGMQPIVYFDEAHILGDEKMMGTVYDQLSGVAFLVSLTGTYYRRDGRPIKGAQLKVIDQKDNVKRTVRRRIDNAHVVETDYKGSKTTYEMEPDFRFPWRGAWDQGSLEKINGVWIGHDVDGVDIGTMKSADIMPGTIRDIIESPKCVAEFAKNIVHELNVAKKFNEKTSSAAAMVVVGSDMANKNGDKEADRHAKQVRDALVSEARNNGLKYDIQIITMASNDSSEKGSDKLENFQNGQYDIVIVKMMGIVGLDVDRLSVLAMMGTLRKGPMLAQCIARNLTVWEDGKGLVPRTIMLGDPLMRESFKQLISDQGGEATSSELTQEAERVVKKDKEDIRQNIGDTNGIVGHVDSDNIEAAGDYLAMVEAVRRKYKHSTAGKTDADIITGMEEGAFPVSDNEVAAVKADLAAAKDKPKAINISQKAADRCFTINEHSKDYANLMHSYASQPKEWVYARTNFVSNAKSFAGIAVKLGDEHDLSKLDKAIDYMMTQISEVLRERA